MKTKKLDPAWAGFVEPLSYGKSHADLANFLLQLFPKSIRKKSKKTKDTFSSKSSLVIEKYREFLLRDCGQMTIEGVSADMDTGQKKFDLERLFVPLKILACPPEFPKSDPERELKRKKWNEENKKSISFGEVLAKGKSLALLALPGGGKTLLLKRLAVAYASPSRLHLSSDELPETQLLPILIRCREWRTYIKLPIMTLLKNIADISGQSDLTGLSEAIIPLLIKGEVLLLVDGLDEIHNEADRTIFVENLESFLEQYNKTRVVVTSREAGFNLVAPSLSRFCERWKIAPLENEAINLLCVHWHRLMVGDTPHADTEGKEVAQLLINNSSLNRLAENPLLLTMLLVVKHGAGSLPPDRVSLYDRAVDVLLDTWNIKGHEPLNAKEAVPQLAYIAFQLMCMGKQTATENELIELLEEARVQHPNIRRYAKDSPYDFLKRVELRSSLLLEAGFQMEKGRAVPFYQFRHLTFQEYLASVAVTEGHYKNYKPDDTVFTPLADYLLAEEWKEIIPMVSVLARKRAEPLLKELIQDSDEKRKKTTIKNKDYQDLDNGLTGSAALLAQCLIEEAEVPPDTLEEALNHIAYFATGQIPIDNWESLCRGPYGRELFSQAWALLNMIGWRERAWLINTAASIAEYQKPKSFWESEEGKEYITSLLQSTEKENKGFGLLICMGHLWNNNDDLSQRLPHLIPLHLVQELIFDPDPVIFSVATWTWVNFRRHQVERSEVSKIILDQFLDNLLEYKYYRAGAISAFALSKEVMHGRGSWKPELTSDQISFIRELNIEYKSGSFSEGGYYKAASFIVGFHLSLWPDNELIKIYKSVKDRLCYRSDDLKRQSIETSLGYVNSKRKKRKTGQA